ncbi:Putative electron transport protein YccM [Poriferisphaera corsica]|uniref:Electron transport protein YccM n=1 Tax=Poriferisphaera corsica TaxID=2528020 RepID=A0A517YRJ2_9BACT|nr:NAD(P)-binding domain-containing protein [Poriferisphaera corsica]QDU32842.1 Putative electron transport protein YccM [Poriferisphaera corsica]
MVTTASGKKRGWFGRYVHWLHTKWPAGTVEKLPDVAPDGTTNVNGLYVVGDLTGVPLLKFSADTGAKSVKNILADPSFQKRTQNDNVIDVLIIGGGVSGFAAAIEAKKAGLTYKLLEASEAFSTIVNFPKAKPIFTYPTDMTPAGDLQFHEKSAIKEGLLEDLNEQITAHNIEPTYARVEFVKKIRGGIFEAKMAKSNVTHKEPMAADIPDMLKAHRVIVGIGRSGNFRKLGAKGEDLDKVYNRLFDPKDFTGKDVVVVGGGDSALEAAIALSTNGANVSVSYRKPEFSRPKPENVDKLNMLASNPSLDVSIEHPTSERVTTASGSFMREDQVKETCTHCGASLVGQPTEGNCPDCGHHYRKFEGALQLMMASKVKEVTEDSITITNSEGQDESFHNDAVFSMIGREPPLDFFRRSNVRIRGEWSGKFITVMIFFILFCFWLYHWKGEKAIPAIGMLQNVGQKVESVTGLNFIDEILSPDPDSILNRWFGSMESMMGDTMGSVMEGMKDQRGTFGVVLTSAGAPAFYYTLAYSIIVVTFGIRRIRRRRTPYIKTQTISLMLIQTIPLFILPELVLPILGYHGFFDSGASAWIADQIFPIVEYGHGREYWRSYGFILAWPLFVYNWFTNEPLYAWLLIGFLQTFVIIPLLIYRFGKGAYCGWICSCGALAETLGDMQRHKMPHGPKWNRLNMVGQFILWIALFMLLLRIIGWIFPSSFIGDLFYVMFTGKVHYESWPFFLKPIGLLLQVFNYQWFVDLLLAGVLGYGLYFMYSGRMWCRFACPLAALMHIYARFTQFRILSDKKKCISCNVCTSVCHQGIDIMNFANKGLPMEDPECVRCSACVQSCPTGVLTFGRIDRRTGVTIGKDKLAASPVQMVEMSVNGKKMPKRVEGLMNRGKKMDQ